MITAGGTTEAPVTDIYLSHASPATRVAKALCEAQAPASASASASAARGTRTGADPTQSKAQRVEEQADVVQVYARQPGCMGLLLLLLGLCLGLRLLHVGGRDDEDVVGAHVRLRGAGAGVDAYLAPAVVARARAGTATAAAVPVTAVGLRVGVCVGMGMGMAWRG